MTANREGWIDDAFWMVYGEGRSAPTIKHGTEGIAIAEAERLARMSPGTAFFVLRAVEMRQVDNMKRVKLCVDEIPF